MRTELGWLVFVFFVGREKERCSFEHLDSECWLGFVGVYLGHGGVAPAVLSSPETFPIFRYPQGCNKEQLLLDFLLCYAP